MDFQHCTCEYKRSLISQMLAMRKAQPGDHTKWVDLLYPKHDSTAGDGYCCLLTTMIYYGYCKNCSTPLSEFARSALNGLLDEYSPASKTVS